MSKLFALEELDTAVDAGELEAAPEVGEVADVQVEVEQDLAEAGQSEAAIDEGMGAADQLEQVEEVVSDAVENGEGLDPVAAEAIRIAVEAICARVGANPKAVYSLYATENFQSASSRKANSKIALEGIGEFLKNLWEKIKAAISGLWEKIKAFWNKHVSSLGRTIKALESMKEKISRTKGTGTFQPVEVPSSLSSIFPTKAATLGIEEIETFGETINAAETAVGKFRLLEDVSKVTKLADIGTAVTAAKGASGHVVEFGSEAKPLPGGAYFKWTYKLETETDDGVEILTLDVDEDHGKFTEGRKDTQLDIASKEKLKALITEAIASTKKLIKYRDRVDQRTKAVQNALKAIDKEISAKQAPDDQKKAKANMRAFNLVMTKGPIAEAKLLSAQLTFIKGILAYAGVCLKNYK